MEVSILSLVSGVRTGPLLKLANEQADFLAVGTPRLPAKSPLPAKEAPNNTLLNAGATGLTGAGLEVLGRQSTSGRSKVTKADLPYKEISDPGGANAERMSNGAYVQHRMNTDPEFRKRYDYREKGPLDTVTETTLSILPASKAYGIVSGLLGKASVSTRNALGALGGATAGVGTNKLIGLSSLFPNANDDRLLAKFNKNEWGTALKYHNRQSASPNGLSSWQDVMNRYRAPKTMATLEAYYDSLPAELQATFDKKQKELLMRKIPGLFGWWMEDAYKQHVDNMRRHSDGASLLR